MFLHNLTVAVLLIGALCISSGSSKAVSNSTEVKATTPASDKEENSTEIPSSFEFQNENEQLPKFIEPPSEDSPNPQVQYPYTQSRRNESTDKPVDLEDIRNGDDLESANTLFVPIIWGGYGGYGGYGYRRRWGGGWGGGWGRGYGGGWGRGYGGGWGGRWGGRWG